jgi:hypothetical protein
MCPVFELPIGNGQQGCFRVRSGVRASLNLDKFNPENFKGLFGASDFVCLEGCFKRCFG